MAANGPQPVQPDAVDLVENQARFTVDHIGGGKRIVHVHAEPLVGRPFDRPLDREGGVGNDIDAPVPLYLEPSGLVPTASYFGASVSVSAAAGNATAMKASVKIVRIIFRPLETPDLSAASCGLSSSRRRASSLRAPVRREAAGPM